MWFQFHQKIKIYTYICINENMYMTRSRNRTVINTNIITMPIHFDIKIQ